MSSQWVSQSKRCAEDIALLHQVTQLPSPPSTNPVAVGPERDDGGSRVLSLGRERGLVSSLAFLAGISDNPNHVIALSIEETPLNKGMRVVIAINKEKRGDGQEILAKISRGFSSIFHLLSQPGAGRDENIEQKVLSLVVQMVRDRILGRIGSSLGKELSSHKQKTFFAGIIETVVNTARRSLRGTPSINVFLDKALALRKCLHDLEKSPSNEVNDKLKTAVALSNELDQAVDISRLLRSIPNREMDSTMREAFPRRVRRLANYLKYSRYLCQTARMNRCLFRNVEVVPVSLESEFFDKESFTVDESSLSRCLSRCDGLSLQQLSRSVSLKGYRIEAVFREEARKRYRDSKIHAEIQILAYFELNPPVNYPRVICSSKSACYLCNAFIRLHGKCTIPSSHGRLYPAWRVPGVPALRQVQEELCLFLESQIAIQAKRLSNSSKKRILDFPNESCLSFPLSIHTILGSEASAQEPSQLPALPSEGPEPDGAVGEPEPAKIPPNIPELPPPAVLPELQGNSPSAPAGSARPSSTSGTAPTRPSSETGSKDRSISAFPAFDNYLTQLPPILSTSRPLLSSEALNAIDKGKEASPSLLTNTDECETTRPASEPTSDAMKSEGGAKDSRRVPSRPPRRSPPPPPRPPPDLPLRPDLDIILTPGQPITCYSKTKHSSIPCSFTAGSLTVFPEFDSKHRMVVEWLRSKESRRVRFAGPKDQPGTGGAAVDVSKMVPAEDVDSGSRDCVILASGTDVVRMRIESIRHQRGRREERQASRSSSKRR